MSEVSAAVAWLERDYAEHGPFRFRSPDSWRPTGFFQVKPDHQPSCSCVSPHSMFVWTQSDVAAKWRVSES